MATKRYHIILDTDSMDFQREISASREAGASGVWQVVFARYCPTHKNLTLSMLPVELFDKGVKDDTVDELLCLLHTFAGSAFTLVETAIETRVEERQERGDDVELGLVIELGKEDN